MFFVQKQKQNKKHTKPGNAEAKEKIKNEFLICGVTPPFTHQCRPSLCEELDHL